MNNGEINEIESINLVLTKVEKIVMVWSWCTPKGDQHHHICDGAQIRSNLVVVDGYFDIIVDVVSGLLGGDGNRGLSRGGRGLPGNVGDYPEKGIISGVGGYP